MAKHKGSGWVGAREGHSVVRTYFLDNADNLSAVSAPGPAEGPRSPFAPAPIEDGDESSAATDKRQDPHSPANPQQEKWIEICDSRRRYHTRLEPSSGPSSAQELRRRLLAPLAPDQRQPFAAILDFAELLRGGTPGDLALGFETRQILASVDQLQRRLELQPRPSSGEQPIPVSSLADQAMAQLQAFCRARNLRVQNHLPASLVCEPDQADALRQSLLNLLLYAVRNSNGLRHVVLVAEPAAREERPTLRLCFTHTGNLAARPLANERPGSRAGITTLDLGKSDLPLRLSERLLESLGASLHTLRLEDYGSAFEIRLPPVRSLQRGKAVPVPRAPLETEGADTTVKLLYIEDNPDHLVLMQRILQKLPNVVYLQACTAEQGLALAFLEVPDIVLLDIRLPRISGLEVLRILRDSPRTLGVRALALSASAFSHDVETGRLLGFRRYLTKPFNVAEFVEILAVEVRDCLRARSSLPR